MNEIFYRDLKLNTLCCCKRGDIVEFSIGGFQRLKYDLKTSTFVFDDDFCFLILHYAQEFDITRKEAMVKLVQDIKEYLHQVVEEHLRGQA